MKRSTIRNGITIAALALAAASTVNAGEKGQCAGCADRAGAPASRELEKKIAEAFQDAARKGATKVDINLDEDPARVERNDLVRVDYVLTLEDGSLVATSRAGVTEDQDRKKSAGYLERNGFAPAEVVSGIPGETPGIAEAVAGMAAGEKKRLSLSPEKGFGAVDPAKIITIPLVKKFPRIIRLNAGDYVKQFEGFPIVGKEVTLSPYFSGKVVEVGDREVRLEAMVKDGARFEESFGTVTSGVKGEEVSLTLTPSLGTTFVIQAREGRIVATDGDNFTVDFNHPLAGKPLVLELEVVSIVKAEALKKVTLPWIEDHDAGLSAAKKENRPAALVLYADWCQWCKKLFAESLEDPRVKNLKDRFVWMKINSDKSQGYKALYGQSGYPMVVLLNPDGSVAGKIDGFRDGGALAGELKGVLNM